MTSSSEAKSTWSPLAFPSAGEAAPPDTRAAAIEPSVAEWVFPDVDASPSPPAEPETDPAEEARRQVYEDGLRDGFERKSREVRSALEGLQRSVDAVQELRTEHARLLTHYVHALAVAVAQKVVQREVALDPTIVRDLVARGMELIPVNSPLEVRMNGEDLEALRPELEATTRRGHPDPIQWLPDPALERGSFLIESPQRVVNGEMDVALRALYERLEYE